MDEAWPALPLSEWEDTCRTLHMWTQIVGKVRLAFTPHMNHWWEAPFYVCARGLTTSPIPYKGGVFEAVFDFLAHELRLETSWGPRAALPLKPQPVAAFYDEFFAALRSVGVECRIRTLPVEVAAPIRFEDDFKHRSYDKEYAGRFFRVLLSADTVFKEFRSRFSGKDSPVHFFWGSFDLAVTRFSGRRAPERPYADRVTKDAYSHEVISAGWWPGGSEITDAAFYCYAVPEPARFHDADVKPPAAFYDAKLGEFLLMYDDVRRSKEPRAALLEFLQSGYDAAAALSGWDRAALEVRPPRAPRTAPAAWPGA